jgi:hypothetical protein
MSIRRWAAKIDKAQPLIVEALRKAGYRVELIRKPVDLVVRHPTWPVNRWMMAEAKTPRSKKSTQARKRNDQEEQDQFCNAFGVPRWTTPDQALEELGAITERLQMDCAAARESTRADRMENEQAKRERLRSEIAQLGRAI